MSLSLWGPLSLELAASSCRNFQSLSIQPRSQVDPAVISFTALEVVRLSRFIYSVILSYVVIFSCSYFIVSEAVNAWVGGAPLARTVC